MVAALLAILIWAILLTLLYIGIYGKPCGKKNKDGSRQPVNIIWKILYVIAWPITTIFVIIGAICMAKDVEKFINRK